jgi:hypothetical protein
MLDNVSEGRDLCGPNPEVQTGDHWRERAVEIEQGAPLPTANEIRAELANVAAVALDVGRAGLAPDSEGAVVVSNDGPTTLTLRGLPAGSEVMSGGARQQAGEDGSVTVDLGGPEDRVSLLP